MRYTFNFNNTILFLSCAKKKLLPKKENGEVAKYSIGNYRKILKYQKHHGRNASRVIFLYNERLLGRLF